MMPVGETPRYGRDCLSSHRIEEAREVALKSFADILLESQGESILGLYLFGSVAKGTARPDSDLDILIVYENASASLILDKVCEISFEILLESGVLVEPVVMSAEEFRSGLGTSPFLWEVLEKGRVLYSKGETTEWKLDFKEYRKLAEEYLSYAVDAHRQGKVRLAIDAGYNAIELLLKALIISIGAGLASSHTGVLQQFGELFVKTGRVEKELGRDVHKALTLRSQARYVPVARLGREDAEAVIATAKKLMEVFQRLVGSERTKDCKDVTG